MARRRLVRDENVGLHVPHRVVDIGKNGPAVADRSMLPKSRMEPPIAFHESIKRSVPNSAITGVRMPDRLAKDAAKPSNAMARNLNDTPVQRAARRPGIHLAAREPLPGYQVFGFMIARDPIRLDTRVQYRC